MTDREAIQRLLEAKLASTRREESLGQEMFRFYTELGFPLDMFMSELNQKLELNDNQKLSILDTFLSEMVEHRKLSGITNKRLEELRRRNRKIIEAFIKTGEIWVY